MLTSEMESMLAIFMLIPTITGGPERKIKAQLVVELQVEPSDAVLFQYRMLSVPSVIYNDTDTRSGTIYSKPAPIKWWLFFQEHITCSKRTERFQKVILGTACSDQYCCFHPDQCHCNQRRCIKTGAFSRSESLFVISLDLNYRHNLTFIHLFADQAFHSFINPPYSNHRVCM